MMTRIVITWLYEGRSVGKMVGGHQHMRPYLIKTEANMATKHLTVISALNITVYTCIYKIKI